MSIASFKLTQFGHYDESLSLIRSISEIGNLVQLFMTDISHFERWRSLSEKERIHKYSPGSVRKKLEQAGSVIPTSREKYSRFCEVAVHATPNIEPQSHSIDQAPTLCGYFQEIGLKKCVNELAWATTTVSGPIAKLAILEKSKAEKIVEASIKLANSISHKKSDFL